ncbi:MAG: nitronate monooxygenase family protein [Gammaproteobacteria bacterium]|nr:nitronate monooxygenase family protein [Gammaproteobacteria bacterium]
MQSPICDMLGCEFPLVAFSHCRDVVAAVSNAGGFGVLGAVGHSPETLDVELSWIDDHVNGKPYGIDLLVPTSMDSKSEALAADELERRIPPQHKQYVLNLLAQYNIPTDDLYRETPRGGVGDNMREKGASIVLDAAFAHPIKLVANALGVPPTFMLERGKREGVPVAALCGAREHAIKHAEAGVDILVVSGTEAGGHCGEVSTMVLIPEVLQSIEPYGEIPVLAAGGIATGRQMAAVMAMGAHGAWTGSVWLTTAEAETAPAVKEKFLAASSRQTVRSRSRTGKYTRQLRSPWTDAWHADEAPDPLPMPLQQLISEPALGKIARLAETGHPGAKQLTTYFVGQAVGLMNQVQSARQVVYDFMEDFLEATERLNAFVDDDAA